MKTMLRKMKYFNSITSLCKGEFNTMEKELRIRVTINDNKKIAFISFQLYLNKYNLITINYILVLKKSIKLIIKKKHKILKHTFFSFVQNFFKKIM